MNYDGPVKLQGRVSLTAAGTTAQRRERLKQSKAKLSHLYINIIY